MADTPLVVEIRLWGELVGAVAALRGRPGYYEFQFSDAFGRSIYELAPLMMPRAPRRRYSFTSLNTETFYGLPGMLADALPDKFGNALIEEYLTRSGTRAGAITTLQRMLYVGRRAMGALEFEPAATSIRAESAAIPLQMSLLVEDARRALKGEFSKVAQDILDIGSSAGGARAKAVIGWNPTTNQVVSGQFELPEGYEHWLLKFDIGTDGNLSYTQGFGRIEYAHYLMATAAGVKMSPCRLLEENGRAHFMTKRFDRIGNHKLHMQSLCGIAHLDFNQPSIHSYEQYLRTILQLNLGADALEQAWLRCAFNVAAVNCDDHTKNLAFLMDKDGQWQLAPAYDTCFSHNPAPGKWTRVHQMLVNGKSWDITPGDLIGLADKFDVRKPSHLLEQIIDTVAQWRKFAEEVNVPHDLIEHIESFHPDWVKPS